MKKVLVGRAKPRPAALSRGERDLRKGMGELSNHRPDLALRSFREAVELCSPKALAELAERHYWLAVAQLRLDQPELALKNLSLSKRYAPSGVGARAWKKRVNAYGMPRRSSPELDDFYAFFSIQTCLFLEGCHGRRFASEGQKDLVTRLVAMAWQNVKCSGRLLGLCAAERLRLFRAWPDVFPAFALGGYSSTARSASSSCHDAVVIEFRTCEKANLRGRSNAEGRRGTQRKEEE
jgi:hypothetical protein